jgi:hypothetical protein
MGKDRLAAFSDGVIAIIITIMVLELKVPHGADWKVLVGVTPGFVSYMLSFVYLAIYWNNHHHLLLAPNLPLRKEHAVGAWVSSSASREVLYVRHFATTRRDPGWSGARDPMHASPKRLARTFAPHRVAGRRIPIPR